MLRTALTLAAKGLAVFPCGVAAKVPTTPHGVKDATTDVNIIRQWWRTDSNYNIAVATGAVSRIFVVDVDGLDAEFELRKLEAEHGELPSSIEVITARGRHIYFQWPAQLVRNSAGRIGPGIDVRGDGGYVLVPPSVHPSGKKYAWSVYCGNSVAEAPEWLLTRANGTNGTNGNGAAAPPSTWRDLVCDGVDEGSRNDSIARLAGYLLRHHVDPIVTLELLSGWNATRCRPPLDGKELATIVDSIAARELKRRGVA
jgi:hypothetical protein